MKKLTKEDVEDMFIELIEDKGYIIRQDFIRDFKKSSYYKIEFFAGLKPDDGSHNRYYIILTDAQRMDLKKRIEIFKKRYYNNFTYRFISTSELRIIPK